MVGEYVQHKKKAAKKTGCLSLRWLFGAWIIRQTTCFHLSRDIRTEGNRLETAMIDVDDNEDTFIPYVNSKKQNPRIIFLIREHLTKPSLFKVVLCRRPSGPLSVSAGVPHDQVGPQNTLGIWASLAARLERMIGERKWKVLTVLQSLRTAAVGSSSGFCVYTPGCSRNTTE